MSIPAKVTANLNAEQQAAMAEMLGEEPLVTRGSLMSVSLLVTHRLWQEAGRDILGALGLAFSIYAIRKPHWPNGCALAVMLQALRLTGCKHSARQWRIERTHEGRLLIDCVACRRHRRARPWQITRFI